MIRWKPRRGHWAPSSLRGGDVRTLMLLFAGAALVRALDYATGVDGSASGTPNSALASVERAFPLAVWAASLTTGALLVLLGMVGRWGTVVATGSLILAVVYFGLATGLGIEYVGRPALDGIRGATGLLVPVVWHVITSSNAIAITRAFARPDGGTRCTR